MIKQVPGAQQLTVGDLQAIISDPRKKRELLERMSSYVGNLPGSDAYWYSKRRDLKAIFNGKGPPTIFFTLSSADTHWPELHDLISTPDADHRTRSVNARKNPHLLTSTFMKRKTLFIETWLRNGLNADWVWHRVEFQMRGATHVHGCAKLKDDPGIMELAAKVYKGDKSPLGSDARRQGDESRTTLIEYMDKHLSAWHPAIETVPGDPPQGVRPPAPEPHPSALPFSDSQEDHTAVHNACLRHHCIGSYCLRPSKSSNNGSNGFECRFNFPKATQAESTITWEELGDLDSSTGL